MKKAPSAAEKMDQPKAAKFRWHILVTLVLVFSLSNLACAIGMLSAEDPIFKTSGDGSKNPPLKFYTPTPDFIFSTPAPIPVIGGPLPSAVPTQPASTMDPNITPVLYYAQSGDSLSAVAARFGVDPTQISSPLAIPAQGLLSPNQLLIIPHGLANTTSPNQLLPNSELTNSPTAMDLDVKVFVEQAGGYLSTYSEWLGTTEWTTGAQIIERVALENSINPRLLLAILEYQSGWVYGQPVSLVATDYPLGYLQANRKGLYAQLVWAVDQLAIGYYGWREGAITQIEFPDGVTARLAPSLNAGTVALQYYFARAFVIEDWVKTLDPQVGFMALYTRMFGDPWLHAQAFEPIFPVGLAQPPLILPFFIGQLWSFTGGPHGAWAHAGSQAALDFSPAREVSGCVDSDAWVLAAISGVVTRSADGVVVVDVDGDGDERTGWNILYLHIATKGRVAKGSSLQSGDLIGHPSCEGGVSTGTHVHMARKYNGEWIAADGPLPFNLDGWVAQAGGEPYQGKLLRDGQIVTASVYGSFESRITRTRNP